MIVKKCLAASLFFVISVLVSATEQADEKIMVSQEINEDAKRLSKILSDTLTYQADFEQSVYRETSDKPEVTLGRFLIQRPNHFKWQTTEPFEQSIIADGRNLWTYDPELEQVTIQNQQSVLADSPLLLLTSSIESLVEAFEIQQIKSLDKDNQQLFALTPRHNSLFESVHILIEDKKIKEFFLVDTLGGRTGVQFSNIQLNQKMDVREFIFVAPDGIDIIDSREVIIDQSVITDQEAITGQEVRIDQDAITDQ